MNDDIIKQLEDMIKAFQDEKKEPKIKIYLQKSEKKYKKILEKYGYEVVLINKKIFPGKLLIEKEYE